MTPTGLALSSDGKTLYATLGDMNAVAVVDHDWLARSRAIPVGWYPTSVVVGSSGNLLVANAKGTMSANPNPQHVKPTKTSPNQYEDTYYDETIIEGNVSNISIPDASDPGRRDGERDRQQRRRRRRDGHALKSASAGSGKIKHVIYIVKENRTYDQVLGDEPRRRTAIPL